MVSGMDVYPDMILKSSGDGEADAGAGEPTGNRDRRAVGAPAGRTRKRAVRIERDGGYAAGDAFDAGDVVAARGKFACHPIRNRAFQFEHAALGPDARRLDRLLQAHAVIDEVDD